MRPPFASVTTLALVVVTLWGCTPKTEISDVQFGSFSGVGSDKVAFEAKNSLSRKDEDVCGWSFLIKEPKSTTQIKEVVEAPRPAWEKSPNPETIQVSDDKRTVTFTNTFVKLGPRFLFHNWSVANTDPIGSYKSTLYIDGKKISEANIVVTE